MELIEQFSKSRRLKKILGQINGQFSLKIGEFLQESPGKFSEGRFGRDSVECCGSFLSEISGGTSSF